MKFGLARAHSCEEKLRYQRQALCLRARYCRLSPDRGNVIITCNTTDLEEVGSHDEGEAAPTDVGR